MMPMRSGLFVVALAATGSYFEACDALKLGRGLQAEAARDRRPEKYMADLEERENIGWKFQELFENFYEKYNSIKLRSGQYPIKHQMGNFSTFYTSEKVTCLLPEFFAGSRDSSGF
jgi:hypothetical protein